MKIALFRFFLSVSVLFFVACGGGGDSKSDETTQKNNSQSKTDNSGSKVGNNEDRVVPIIKLNGDKTINLNIGDKYIELGATANDNIDGNITNDIIISGSVDTSIKASYTILYKVKDSSNNEANITRVIVVGVWRVKKTGQIISYDEKGNIKSDNSILDDGYYKSGISQNYTRDDIKYIVTDHISKLMWQDNIDNKTLTKSWSEANSYCLNLTLDGFNNWRLPRYKELLYILDSSRFYPSSISRVFLNSATKYYWSSTLYYNSQSKIISAYIVNFSDGHSMVSSKGLKYNFRCVRDGL